VGEAAHDAAVPRFARDRRRRCLPGREHPELTRFVQPRAAFVHATERRVSRTRWAR
jgi:hypothetical protein